MFFKLSAVLAITMLQAVGADTPQRVEGFAAVVHSPSANSRPGTMPADFRGPAPGHMTKPWWTTGPPELLQWKTAVVPENRQTIFSFVGASAVVPAEFSRGPMARLFVNGKPAVTFEIGQTRDRVWKEGAVELRYESRRSNGRIRRSPAVLSEWRQRHLQSVEYPHRRSRRARARFSQLNYCHFQRGRTGGLW